MIPKIVFSVMCLVVAGLACGPAAHSDLVDRVAAVVNDDIILQSELDEALMAIGVSLDQKGYSLSDKSRILREQRPKVLAQLIDDKLTDQQVGRHNIEIDDDGVDATVQRILAANRMNEDELRRALKLSGIEFEDYRQQIRTRMLRARLLSREVQSKIVVTDTDIKNYYEGHKDLYTGFIKYDLRHLLMRISPGAGQLEKMQVEQQVDDLHKRLQAGEAFDELARLYSQASSASQGGSLGVFSANSLTDQVRKALDGLAEKEFTRVLDTEQGFQIFYIEKIVSSGGKSLEEATPEIQDKLHAEVVDKKFRSWLEDLRQRSHIQIMQ